MTATTSGRPASTVDAVNATTKLDLLDTLALIAVFLQVSELYRPLAYLLRFPTSAQANVLFLSFFLFYLLLRNSTLAKPNFRLIRGWAYAFVLAPTAIMFLQLLDNSVRFDKLVYWVLFALLFAALFMAAAVLWSRMGSKLSMPFFLACIGGTWLGFIVNLLDYEFLRKVMLFGSIDTHVSSATDRLVGFYQHPNVAAFSLMLYFAILCCTQEFLQSNRILRALTITSCAVGIFFTGSRTSALIFIIALVWYVRNLRIATRKNSAAKQKRQASTVILPTAIAMITVCAVALIFRSQSNIVANASSRMSSILEVFGGNEDASVNLRSSILEYYYADIMRSPLLGRGPEFVTTQIRSAAYTNVSQNAWLDWSLAWGIPYAVLMAAMLLSTYKLALKVCHSNPLLLAGSRLILVIFVLITFSMVYPFWIRSTVGALAVLLGLLAHEEAQQETRVDSKN